MPNESGTRTSTWGTVQLYAVEIEGRGGNNAQKCYFAERDHAVIASAIDKQNRVCQVVDAIRLEHWDGSVAYVLDQRFRLTPPPSDADVRALKDRLSCALTPAHRVLFGIPDDK